MEQSLKVLANEMAEEQLSNNPKGISVRLVQPENVLSKDVDCVQLSNKPEGIFARFIQLVNVFLKEVANVQLLKKSEGIIVNGHSENEFSKDITSENESG